MKKFIIGMVALALCAVSSVGFAMSAVSVDNLAMAPQSRTEGQLSTTDKAGEAYVSAAEDAFVKRATAGMPQEKIDEAMALWREIAAKAENRTAAWAAFVNAMNAGTNKDIQDKLSMLGAQLIGNVRGQNANLSLGEKAGKPVLNVTMTDKAGAVTSTDQISVQENAIKNSEFQRQWVDYEKGSATANANALKGSDRAAAEKIVDRMNKFDKDINLTGRSKQNFRGFNLNGGQWIGINQEMVNKAENKKLGIFFPVAHEIFDSALEDSDVPAGVSVHMFNRGGGKKDVATNRQVTQGGLQYATAADLIAAMEAASVTPISEETKKFIEYNYANGFTNERALWGMQAKLLGETENDSFSAFLETLNKVTVPNTYLGEKFAGATDAEAAAEAAAVMKKANPDYSAEGKTAAQVIKEATDATNTAYINEVQQPIQGKGVRNAITRQTDMGIARPGFASAVTADFEKLGTIDEASFNDNQPIRGIGAQAVYEGGVFTQGFSEVVENVLLINQNKPNLEVKNPIFVQVAAANEADFNKKMAAAGIAKFFQAVVKGDESAQLGARIAKKTVLVVQVVNDGFAKAFSGAATVNFVELNSAADFSEAALGTSSGMMARAVLMAAISGNTSLLNTLKDMLAKGLALFDETKLSPSAKTEFTQKIEAAKLRYRALVGALKKA